MEVVYERKVNYYETDRMGVTHHSNYIRFFEEARVFFMDKTEMSYGKLEETGIIMPVLSVNCSYIKSSGFDDVLLIKTALTRVTPVKAAFSYEAYNKNSGELICKGSSLHGFLNNSFKPMSLKHDRPEVYKKLSEYMQN